MSANADLITVETYVQQGETMNPEVLKCHEDRITLDTYVQQGKTMDNKFYIYVKH